MSACSCKWVLTLHNRALRIKPLDDATTLADVRLGVHDLDVELRATEVEPIGLVAGSAVDVELVRLAVRNDERAQTATHVHQIFGEAVARLGDEPRAVVDERSELSATDVAGGVAHVGPRVKVADDEVERMLELEPHVPLGTEHVHHAAARTAAPIEVAIQRRTA